MKAVWISKLLTNFKKIFVKLNHFYDMCTFSSLCFCKPCRIYQNRINIQHDGKRAVANLLNGLCKCKLLDLWIYRNDEINNVLVTVWSKPHWKQLFDKVSDIVSAIMNSLTIYYQCVLTHDKTCVTFRMKFWIKLSWVFFHSTSITIWFE